jgi:hypothetical protein
MKIKSILKALGKGALKSIPGANVLTEVTESMKEGSDHSPEGQIDYARLIGYGIFSIVMLAFIFGYADEEKVKFVLDKIVKLFLVD